MKNKVSKIKVENLKKSINEAINYLGGLEQFFNIGDVVLLKPNFNTADPFPASTDIDFLETVIDLVHEAGAESIVVGESSTVLRSTEKELRKKNVFSLQDRVNPVKVKNFDHDEWIKKRIPKGEFLKKVSVPKTLLGVDKVIFLPCLKTHKYSKFSGSLKLSVGFMKSSERVMLHAWGLQEKIAELNRIISPDLIIMDARKCFINGGPIKGEVKDPNLIMASTDRVAIDIEGIELIKKYRGNSLKDINPRELTQIKNFIEWENSL